MNYFKSHKEFASQLNRYHSINEQDILDHPENYLGPNYKEVLNFWLYWDSLSNEKWYVFCIRVCSLDVGTWSEARSTAEELTKEVIDPRFVDYLYPIELELIVAHLYIERGIPFTYLPLMFDL